MARRNEKKHQKRKEKEKRHERKAKKRLSHSLTSGSASLDPSLGAVVTGTTEENDTETGGDKNENTNDEEQSPGVVAPVATENERKREERDEKDHLSHRIPDRDDSIAEEVMPQRNLGSVSRRVPFRGSNSRRPSDTRNGVIVPVGMTMAKDSFSSSSSFREEAGTASTQCPACKKECDKIRFDVIDASGGVVRTRRIVSPCTCPEYFLAPRKPVHG